jgi:hypothetical protein
MLALNGNGPYAYEKAWDARTLLYGLDVTAAGYKFPKAVID